MERPFLTRFVVASALLGAGACSEVTNDFVCQTDADCMLADGTAGRCEDDQRCSYADASCQSGFRYGDLAGDESNACTTPGGGPGDPGGPDACIVAEVRAGVHDTCVRRTDGTVWCFGDGMPAATQVAMPGGTITQVDVAAGGLCARYSDGSLDCTKGPATGEIGITAKQVAIGTSHVCAITDGHIDCWGTNASGELGVGNETASNSPQQVIAVTNAVQMAAGLATTYEVEDGGELWCWGDNSRNQLGQTIIVPDHADSPMEIFPEDNGASAVAAGDKFGCLLSLGGHVQCWGDETKGQTGLGVAGDNSANLVDVPMLTGIAQITASGGHACARETSGRVWCWGDNTANQSSAATAAIVGPTLVVDRHGTTLMFLDVDAGPQHTCGRLAPDGAVVCWGDNSSGEIGDGMTTPAVYPTPSKLGCP